MSTWEWAAYYGYLAVFSGVVISVAVGVFQIKRVLTRIADALERSGRRPGN